jgi:lipopolysaccharide transport system ATP-binding protein
MSAHPPTDAAPLISLRNVSVSYWLKAGAVFRKRHYPLKDVSFDLYQGESLGVIGKNGCGKSTLLRLLGGIMSPDSGQLTMHHKLRTSLLSLQIGFANHLPGRENAILGGMFLGMTHKEIESRMDAIIDFAEIGEFMDQPLCTYSSGMRARLGFAVAFQVNPDVLLVDEITGVGDIAFAEKSYRAMKDRLNSRDSTIVFVSHQASQIRAMCDRAIWIDDGMVRLAGEVDHVLTEYENALAPLEKSPKEKAEHAISTCTDYIDFSSGFYSLEKAHVWLQKTTVFTFKKGLKEFSFTLAPPSGAIRAHGNIVVTVSNDETGETERHEYQDAKPHTFSVLSPNPGQSVSISASDDYCPADHGGSDPRRLAVMFYEPCCTA